ncbi:uncharacterized protein LOC122008004 [Zingiber officinale]|uniref:uncharacterized protein LOC122008004 n=1 Tax=Zingiber officinale TaxID=94328 RepID=UPI001C4B900C|nr:uncharacterized protein LOC122008004 [Zingiber officinale]XP_042419501.1 uncharacterized protein LOC122008004 [Zingiber officinale]
MSNFRRGLEELVRGHIDGCMTAALASCGSSADAGDGEDDQLAAGGSEGSDQLSRRRRRNGDDQEETSAAARLHSRILSRWVARQAEEMITTIERRNRESELMALARLHAVSMLDSSFLRESRRPQTTVERPAAVRASSVLQRWRELEDASAAARERETMRSPSPAATPQNLRTGVESLSRDEWIDSSGLGSSVSDDNGNEFRREGNQPSGIATIQTETTGNRESSREQSPDFGDVFNGERERVRQIVRGWVMSTAMAANTALRATQQRNESPGNDWLGEIERERVRLVRERVRMVSQERHSQVNRIGEAERVALATDRVDPQEQSRREQPRLRGRQARLDLIMRMVRERERELQGLSEHHAVSAFAHRNRIQALLEERFLSNFAQSEEHSSVVGREFRQLGQCPPLSGLREGLHSQEDRTISQSGALSIQEINYNGNGSSSSSMVEVSNNDLDQDRVDDENELYASANRVTNQMENDTESENAEWTEDATQAEDLQEDAEHGEEIWHQYTEDRLNESSEDDYEESWQENIDYMQPHDTPEGSADNTHEEVHEYWREDDSQEAVPIWQDESLDSLQNQQSFTVRRVNRFILPDDDNVYSMELRELLRRRSVSNLLSSEFRESLDQLIESYAQRQERNPFDWDLQMASASGSIEVDQGQQRDDLVQDQIAVSVAPPTLPSPPVPPPPPPPPRPLWHSTLHHTNWTRQSFQHSEWDVINDLRSDMARLKEGMNHMQQMVEACMDMQLELQRAVRQEVSAALNRRTGGQGEEQLHWEDTSKWGQARRGTCCICCDSPIDSLLYRCGHMCACSKCANELVRTEGRCPLCRAPILEVIRAYSVL